MLVEFMLFCTKPELVHVSGQWFLVIFVAVGSSIRRVQVSCKMVLRQPAYRQQVGTLYEMTSPSSLWNASPQTTQQSSLSAFPPTRARVKHARALAEPQLDKRQRAEDSAGSVETQQDD